MHGMFYGALSSIPSSKHHIHNLVLVTYTIPMQKSSAYVNNKYKKATYLTANGPGAVPSVDASSSDICVGTWHTPKTAPIAVHHQSDWLSSLTPYISVYIANIVLHYPNYTFCRC